MGRHVQRQTPQKMPTEDQVQKFAGELAKPFLVAGSRGLTSGENKSPDFAVHGQCRFVTGKPADFAGKHAIVFIHGYNVTPTEALQSAAEFFKLLHGSLLHDQIDTAACTYALFTWPGDTGTMYFNDAQEYAQHSGSALFEMFKQLHGPAGTPSRLTIVTHSLGAHVGLRALSALGERRVSGSVKFRVDHALLLGAAVEDDVFHRPDRQDEYHFPEAGFGMRELHMVTSRDDDVLGKGFYFNEFDKALGFSGPEDMGALVSLSRHVQELLDDESFTFEQHDFSRSSGAIMNPALHVRSHGDYWKTPQQTNYYVNLIR